MAMKMVLSPLGRITNIPASEKTAGSDVLGRPLEIYNPHERATASVIP